MNSLWAQWNLQIYFNLHLSKLQATTQLIFRRNGWKGVMNDWVLRQDDVSLGFCRLRSRQNRRLSHSPQIGSIKSGDPFVFAGTEREERTFPFSSRIVHAKVLVRRTDWRGVALETLMRLDRIDLNKYTRESAGELIKFPPVHQSPASSLGGYLIELITQAFRIFIA